MTDALKETIQKDLNEARKARDKTTTAVLSMTLSEIRNFEIDQGGGADDEAVREVVTRAVKRRREAADQMRAGGREELAAREEAEAEILKRYLPPELSEEEVRAIIREIIGAGTTQMGPVMGQVMPRVKGRFDGKAVNRLVREELEG